MSKPQRTITLDGPTPEHMAKVQFEHIETDRTVAGHKTARKIMALDYLLKRGRISHDQYVAGMIFSEAYEQGQCGLYPAPSLGEDLVDGQSDPELRLARQVDQKSALREFYRVLPRETVAVMNRVAGEGRSIHSFATSGSNHQAHMNLLREGLDCLVSKMRRG